MSTPGGDSDGPASRPGPQGLWAGMWRLLGRQTPDHARLAVVEPDGVYSRDALEAMVERKRRNDSERRREFALLRKLRRTEGLPVSPPQSTPSLIFHSSISSGPGERATTLKKINEIEAQMATQWRRFTGRSVSSPQSASSDAPVDHDGRTTERQASQADATTAAQAPTVFDVTSPPTAPRPIGAGQAQPRGSDPGQNTASLEVMRAASGFGASRADAMEVQEFVYDPDLEEAALRFASGDAAGSEAALLALLAPGHPRADHSETWHVLFDLYRVTGQQSRYDDCAADFANLFERSPPQWGSLDAPAELLAGVPSAFPASAAGPGQTPVDWACPPGLDLRAVTALVALLADLPQPWRLSWGDMNTIEADALPALAALVGQWVAKPVKLRFVGAERLERLVEARTVRGEPTVDTAWWTLRLDLLRAMRRSQEYELAALDYCITYEVSPPSWDLPRCEIRSEPTGTPGEGDTRFDAFEEFESRVSAMGPGDFVSAFAAPAAGELSGALVGDPAEALTRLDARLQGAQTLLISCARLERIDFEAAGALLNWVAARQAEGRTVHLTDLHRLVAVFLGAMGLGVQARLSVRRD